MKALIAIALIVCSTGTLAQQQQSYNNCKAAGGNFEQCKQYLSEAARKSVDKHERTMQQDADFNRNVVRQATPRK